MSSLLGEVVSWSLRQFKVSFVDLVGFLNRAGLDSKLARGMSPRSAFGRACRRLSESRVIRRVEEDEDEIIFQFTREGKGTDKLYEYWTESLVRLNKKSGNITADVDVLRDRAQKELDQAMGERTGSDVSALVQKIFEGTGDLWHIQGNVWLVPEKNLETVKKVEEFLGYMVQKISRFPVPKGTPEGDRSVRDVVVNGLKKLIENHKRTVESFSDTTKGSTLERVVDKIKESEFKVEAYAELLASQKEALEVGLKECKALLRKKIETMHSEVVA